MSDFVEYKPMDVEHNVKAAVENLRKAYWSNETEKVAKAFTEAEGIIVSAICHDTYTVCKPVDTSGDLISREALKEAIKDNGYSHYFEILDIIDNAPTVEFPPVINMKPLTAEEKQGLIDAFKKSGLKAIKLDDGGCERLFREL